MITHLRDFKTDFKVKEALPRMLADLVIVQTAAVLSLLATFIYYIFFNGGEVPSREFFLDTLRNVYLAQFPVLSVVFPTTFLLSGIYTHSRCYTARYKWLLLLRGCLLASLCYVFATFLWRREDLPPRSMLVLFPLLVTAGVTGVRWFNLWIESVNTGRHGRAPLQSGRQIGSPVLVAGGAGYIGAVVVRKLLERGLQVRLLDNLTYGDSAIAELLTHPGLDFVQGDCRNIQDVVKAMNGVRDVIHLAAIVGDPACAADDKNALEINYAATRMMIEVAKGEGVERFIFASSCSVYGASDFLMDERSLTVPVSLYAETKLNSENALLEAKSNAFHPVILRFATVFGLAPRPRFDLVVNLLTAKAYQEGLITIFNGSQWRPFIHVEDIAEGICLTLEAPIAKVSGEVFNVGDDRLNYTLEQVAEIIQCEFPETAVEYTENADRRNYRVSFAKIRERLNFEAKKTIEEGVRELRLAFERGGIQSYKDPFYSNLAYLKAYGGADPECELDTRVMAAFAEPTASLAALCRNLADQQTAVVEPVRS